MIEWVFGERAFIHVLVARMGQLTGIAANVGRLPTEDEAAVPRSVNLVGPAGPRP